MAQQIEATVLKVGTAPLLFEPQSWSFPVSAIAIEEVISGDINASILWLDVLYYVSETLDDLVTAANAGGGGGVTIYTGDDSITGDRIADLAGHSVTFSQDGNPILFLNPASFNNQMQARDGLGANTTMLMTADSSDPTITVYLEAGGPDNDLIMRLDAVSGEAGFYGTNNNTEMTINDATQVIQLNALKTNLSNILNLSVSANASPADGDIWLESNTNTGLKIRLNGVTKTITVS